MTVAKKQEAEKLITVQAAVPVLVCRANRPLTEEQHEELVRKLKAEQARTGLEIVLIPYSVDVVVAAELKEVTASDPAKEEEVNATANDE